MQKLQKHHKRQEISSEQTFFVRFLGFASNLLKYMKLFESFHSRVSVSQIIRKAFFLESTRNFFEVFDSWSIRNFSSVDFFYFLSLGWKMQGFTWENIGKAFFWENIRIFLILVLESSISGNIRNFFGGEFFLFYFGGAWAGKCPW